MPLSVPGTARITFISIAASRCIRDAPASGLTVAGRAAGMNLNTRTPLRTGDVPVRDTGSLDRPQPTECALRDDDRSRPAGQVQQRSAPGIC
jgi:hypothetical protein